MPTHGRLKMNGFLAWLLWIVVHIYYLTGFRRRLLVVLHWAWSYLSFHRGARLIVSKEWRFHRPEEVQPKATKDEGN
jgi:NADH dehydrogenase